MSIVGRKGKLSLYTPEGVSEESNWDRLEDVLTADVFGAYRYLPNNLGLLPFILNGVDENGNTLTEFFESLEIDIESLPYARILFWPTLTDDKEPDLLIMLGDTSESFSVALLVEAKFYSRQHEIISNDIVNSQLGHYAILHIQGSYRSDYLRFKLPPVRPILYITRANTIPGDELRRARAEVLASGSELARSDIGIFWCSWGMAGAEAKKIWMAKRNDVPSNPWIRLLLDLYRDLDHRDLMPREPFQGCPGSQGIQLRWDIRSLGRVPPFTGCLPSDPIRKRASGMTSFGNYLKLALYMQRESGTPNFSMNIPLQPVIERDIGIPTWLGGELPIYQPYMLER